MLRLKKNSKRIPYGGHHYPEYGLTFRGESFEEVVKALKAFRVNNHIQLGEPEQDVLIFYANNWPWLVESISREESGKESAQLAEYRAWVNKVWKNPPTLFLTRKEAEARWKVCENCPFNVPYDFPETAETSELKRRVFLLRRGMEAPENIHFCALHKADLSALSFFSPAHKFLGVESKLPSPEGCWADKI